MPELLFEYGSKREIASRELLSDLSDDELLEELQMGREWVGIGLESRADTAAGFAMGCFATAREIERRRIENGNTGA